MQTAQPQPAAAKLSRAEQSRINGAKSRGPKTPQGKDRSRAASTRHGFYSGTVNLLATVDQPEYAALRQRYLDAWQPHNPYLADKVDDLVALRWELSRLRAVRRQFLERVFLEASTISPIDGSIVCETELRAQVPGGSLERFDLRIRRCLLEISRLERDLCRLHHHFAGSDPTQMSLETQGPEPNREPEPTHEPASPAAAWAARQFELTLDPHQAAILDAHAPRTLVAASRFSGKTTALALRALYTSVHEPHSRIACLSPNPDLREAIERRAAQIGHRPGNIDYALSPTATLVLIDDAANIPDDAWRHASPGAIVILAATPQGAHGRFYDLWREAAGDCIHVPARDSAVVGELLRRRALEQLSEPVFLQEFKAEFLELPQPRCTVE